MIVLEHIGDGSIADRNFQTLMQVVPDTGGISVGLRSGTEFVTFSASTTSNTVTVTHGLNKTPRVTIGSAASTVKFAVLNKTTTTFDIFGRADSSTSATVNFDWIAVG